MRSSEIPYRPFYSFSVGLVTEPCSLFDAIAKISNGLLNKKGHLKSLYHLNIVMDIRVLASIPDVMI